MKWFTDSNYLSDKQAFTDALYNNVINCRAYKNGTNAGLQEISNLITGQVLDNYLEVAYSSNNYFKGVANNPIPVQSPYNGNFINNLFIKGCYMLDKRLTDDSELAQHLNGGSWDGNLRDQIWIILSEIENTSKMKPEWNKYLKPNSFTGSSQQMIIPSSSGIDMKMIAIAGAAILALIFFMKKK